ncbi:hypothetical protein PVAP13_9NG682014 [Panicum virgatum]|uniref:Uncharacterized protein n=1 Tax=Panicum virgatum TaxID=38727 RepID=A0A8T0MY03_PANVG|nr:hypothetical protein PVAP13_9NG682014 [Panicum virgatum]
MFPYCPWAHLDEAPPVDKAPPVRLCLVLPFPVRDRRGPTPPACLAPSLLLPPAGGRASTFPRSADLVGAPRPGARAWPRRSPARAPPGCSRARPPARAPVRLLQLAPLLPAHWRGWRRRDGFVGLLRG